MTLTTSTTHSLSDQIKTAIVKNDISSMYKLKDICDRIHSTGKDYETYTPDDLPSDILYEEMVGRINSIATELRIVTQRGLETNAAYIRKDGQGISTADVKHRHEKYISDMWMGSITKLPDIKQMSDTIVLPKFDGCSCGVRLKRLIDGSFEVSEALTRGMEEGYKTKKSNITDKFIQISNELTQNLSSLDYEFMNGRNLKEVTSLTLRGEIVLKTKETTTSAPASFIAGKINGYMEVWEDSVEFIEFIPYEFIRLYFSDDKYDIYIPTQFESIDLLEQCDLFNFPYELLDLNPTNSSPVIETYFNKLEGEITEPIDGVVYCSQTWRYPLKSEETKPKAYGKYAWKPNSEVTSTLRNINYTLARDGKFTFILCYDPVNIKGKNYKQAKTVTSRMLMLEGMGMGSIITVKLAGDIPMVVDFVDDPEITPYELPTKCPFCGEETKLKRGKTPTLSCVNPNCREVTKQKMVNFLKLIGIKGIAEGKLNAINEMTFENVDKTYLRKSLVLRNFLESVDTRTFLMALGIGGKTKVDKLIPDEMNPLLSVVDNFNDIIDVVDPFYQKDPFIKDIIDYISEILFK
jgi:hypothetical protein